MAIVILNKDNAEGLRETLSSLLEQSCPLCTCFDLYVVDGGSRDNSKEIFENLSRDRDCMYFIEQSVKRGTGPARREVIERLLRDKYDLVIWGDSENKYDRDYIINILERFCSERDREKDKILIISGRSIVRSESIWSHVFFWYHTYHQIFPVGVGDRHAPGNNKCEQTLVYRYLIYPPCSRSEDFIFSYYLYKNFREKIKYIHERRAVVRVALPKTFRDIVRWQRARVKGLVECSRYMGYRSPPDFIYWFVFFLYNILLLLLSLTGNIISVILYTLSIGLASLFLFVKSRDSIERPSIFTGFLGYIGLFLHSLFTLYYVIKFSRET
ncbi:MAG: glycosyltransferase family A protein [Sulfolobales archaeon]